MTFAATPELFWLTLVVLLTALSSLPYVAEVIARTGLLAAMGEGAGPPPNEAAWALRARRAHANAVENLVVFAPLVLMIVLMEAGNRATEAATAAYFFARVVHYIVYVAGVPDVRTIAFLVGLAAQLLLVARLFGY